MPVSVPVSVPAPVDDNFYMPRTVHTVWTLLLVGLNKHSRIWHFHVFCVYILWLRATRVFYYNLLA